MSSSDLAIKAVQQVAVDALKTSAAIFASSLKEYRAAEGDEEKEVGEKRAEIIKAYEKSMGEHFPDVDIDGIVEDAVQLIEHVTD